MIQRFALTILCFCIGPSVHAASFDCAKASTPMEKAVCSDPDLSKADEALANAYHAALKPLSPEAQAATRATQKGWLNMARKVCHFDDTKPTVDNPSASGSSCLANLYRDRQAQLKNASPHAGELQFYETGTFRTAPVPEGWEGNYDLMRLSTIHLQIDLPSNDDQQAWNSYMASVKVLDSDTDEVDGDHFETPKLIGAGRDYISVVIEFGDYEGGAHPTGGAMVSTRLLKERRAVQGSDLLLPGSGWEKAVIASVTRIANDYIEQNDTQPNPGGAVQEAGDAVVDDLKKGNVSIGQDGAGSYFSSYQFGAYISGLPDHMIIPWVDLKSYLNLQSPLTLPPK